MTVRDAGGSVSLSPAPPPKRGEKTMNKRKLAVLASCLLLHAGIMPVAGAAQAAGEVEIKEEASEDVELEEVVVTADKLKQNKGTKITVVNEEQIKAQGARNVAEALKDVPGLYVSSNDAQGKSVAMFRGSDAENTRVFVDGVPLTPVVDGKVDLSTIPAETIEKIEVIKGAVPVIYGIDAPGGVIYITTKQTGEKTNNLLSVVTGDHRDESMFGATSGRIGRLSYLLDVKKEHTDGYTLHAKSEEKNLHAKFKYDLSPKSSLTVMGAYTEKYKQVPNRIDPATGMVYFSSSLYSSAQAGYFNNTYNWEYEPWKSSYVSTVYNQKLSEDNELSLRVYRTNERAHLKAYGWAGPFGDQQDWRHRYTDGRVDGLELQDKLSTSKANTITWGYTYETRHYNELCDALMSYTEGTTTSYYTGTTRSEYDYTGKSIYLQDDLQVNRKLALNFGLRYQQTNDWSNIHPYGDTLSPIDPRVGTSGKGSTTKPAASFTYALTGRTTLHGAFAESYRWPNISERLGPGGVYGAYGTSEWRDTDPNTGQQTRDPVTGDVIWQQWWHWPDGTWHLPVTSVYLLPEEAINREIGLSHTFPFGLKLDVTYFYKNIKNMIKGQEASYNLAGQLLYYNVPEVTMHGYEVEGSYPLGKRIKGFVNFSYTNAYDPVAWRQVCDVPLRKYSYGFMYTGDDGVKAYLSLNYSGAYYSSFTTGNGNGAGDSNSVTLWTVPAHRTVDLKVSKEKVNREYYVRVTNLLDEKYYQGYYLQAPGRGVEFGGTVKF